MSVLHLIREIACVIRLRALIGRVFIEDRITYSGKSKKTKTRSPKPSRSAWHRCTEMYWIWSQNSNDIGFLLIIILGNKGRTVEIWETKHGYLQGFNNLLIVHWDLLCCQRYRMHALNFCACAAPAHCRCIPACFHFETAGLLRDLAGSGKWSVDQILNRHKCSIIPDKIRLQTKLTW